MLGSASKTYLLDPSFFQEGNQVGQGTTLHGPYREQGFASPVLSREAFENFVNRRNGDGTPMLRQQHNASQNLQCFVLGMPRSCNAMLLTEMKEMSPQEAKARAHQAADALREAAVMAYNELLKECVIARGAQRSIVEQGERLAALSIHGMNNQGDLHVHGHLFFHNCGYSQEQKRCYSVMDARDVYRVQSAVSERFHFHLENQLAVRMGWTMALDKNGHAQAHGYDQRIYETMTGTGRERIETYLRENNLPSNEVTRGYAALNVRESGPRPEFKLTEQIDRWQHQALELSQRPMFADDAEKRSAEKPIPTKLEKAQIERQERREMQRAMEREFASDLMAVRSPIEIDYKRGQAIVKVRDPNRLILDTKATPRLEAHKKAFQAMKTSPWASTSPIKTLELGEKAFQEARKPKLDLRPGDRIVLSKQALEQLTATQRKALERIAKTHDVTINLPELRTQQEHKRRAQEHRQNRSL